MVSMHERRCCRASCQDGDLEIKIYHRCRDPAPKLPTIGPRCWQLGRCSRIHKRGEEHWSIVCKMLKPVSEVFTGVEVDWSSLPLSTQSPCSSFAAVAQLVRRVVFSWSMLVTWKKGKYRQVASYKLEARASGKPVRTPRRLHTVHSSPLVENRAALEKQ